MFHFRCKLVFSPTLLLLLIFPNTTDNVLNLLVVGMVYNLQKQLPELFARLGLVDHANIELSYDLVHIVQVNLKLIVLLKIRDLEFCWLHFRMALKLFRHGQYFFRLLSTHGEMFLH